jgi:hypothetical protein
MAFLFREIPFSSRIPPAIATLVGGYFRQITIAGYVPFAMP